MLRYYHYRHLSARSKKAYKTIMTAVRSFLPSAVINRVDNIKVLLDAVKNDNPHLFYINWYTVYYKLDFRGHKTIINFDYLMDKQDAVAYWKRAQDIASRLQGNSDYNTIRNVHDYIAKQVKYDRNVTNMHGFRINDHNMIGPIFEGIGVCEGISRAAQFLLRELGVECTYQTGEVNENGVSGYHAWNLVRFEGKQRKMDITWDLAEYSGKISYKYFCISA